MRISTARFYEKLFAVTVSESIDKVTEFAYEVWGAPVSICDVEYNILSMHPSSSIRNDVWDSLTGSKRVPNNMVVQFIEEGYLSEPSRTDRAVVVDWGVIAGHPRVICRICVDGMVRGFVSLLSETLRWTEEDSRRLEEIARAASPAFRRLDDGSMDSQSIRPAFLSYLLDGRIENQTVLKRWLTGLKLELKDYFWLMACGPTIDMVATTHMAYICRRLTSAFPEAPIVRKNDAIYLLFNSSDQHYLRSVLQNPIFIHMQQMGMMFGVGRTYYDVLKTPVFRRQADFALEKGRRSESDALVYSYKDFVLDNIFSCICENIPSENYMHPAVFLLREYDKKHATEYLRTLKTYICCFCSQSETVRALAIHRNTLVYRLKQISSITALDLTDIDTRVNLLIDFYAWDGLPE